MEGIFPSRDLESPRVSGQYSHVTRLETESRSSRIKGTLPGWYMWMVGPSLMAGWGSWEKSEHSATDNPWGHQHWWARCPSNHLLYVRAEELGMAVAMDRSEWRETFNWLMLNEHQLCSRCSADPLWRPRFSNYDFSDSWGRTILLRLSLIGCSRRQWLLPTKCQ